MLFLLLVQLVDGFQHLPDLVGFGHTLTVLNVHAWVPDPRRFVYPVTCPHLPGFSEIMLTHLTQIREFDVGVVVPNTLNKLVYSVHASIVSIVVSFVKTLLLSVCFHLCGDPVPQWCGLGGAGRGDFKVWGCAEFPVRYWCMFDAPVVIVSGRRNQKGKNSMSKETKKHLRSAR